MLGTTFIIPSMHFTCRGTITRWTVAGEIVEVVNDRTRDQDMYPKLQIWRQQRLNEYSTRPALEIPLLTCNGDRVTGTNNIYECFLSPGVDVQPNDVLGLYLTKADPMRMFSSFSVYIDSTSLRLMRIYSTSGTPTMLSIDNMNVGDFEVEEGLPLVALQVVTSNGITLNY